MKVSLVLVTHRSSRVLADALSSFRTEAEAMGASFETIVVEQSDDPEEVERAKARQPGRLVVQANRGYAAGINAGVRIARGDVLLVGNPDIRFLPGSLRLLLEALDDGWDIVGPQFMLAGCRFPPAETQTPVSELARLRARKSPTAWHRFYKKEIRRCMRVWQSASTIETPTLSGALLACGRDIFRRVGPWDDGYFLYFEETDWLRGARRLGARLAVVPGARVVHAWGHAASPALYHDHFSRSRARYYDRNFGLIGRLTARRPAPPSPLTLRDWSDAEGSRDGLRWLISPTSIGFPAAFVDNDASSPKDVAREIALATGRSDPLTLLAFDPATASVEGVYQSAVESTGAAAEHE